MLSLSPSLSLWGFDVASLKAPQHASQVYELLNDSSLNDPITMSYVREVIHMELQCCHTEIGQAAHNPCCSHTGWRRMMSLRCTHLCSFVAFCFQC